MTEIKKQVSESSLLIAKFTIEHGNPVDLRRFPGQYSCVFERRGQTVAALFRAGNGFVIGRDLLETAPSSELELSTVLPDAMANKGIGKEVVEGGLGYKFLEYGLVGEPSEFTYYDPITGKPLSMLLPNRPGWESVQPRYNAFVRNLVELIEASKL
jgi:hypothetical protein